MEGTVLQGVADSTGMGITGMEIDHTVESDKAQWHLGLGLYTFMDVGGLLLIVVIIRYRVIERWQRSR
ncbi:hypothetical protein TSUD_154340 [Trifolium subterraneum]|uniref:Uncharacterized protein n=1 Tax=Trifolium subterraneum TaxID=3900 RepID=A0A2Z6PB60_TRISU|nr:hypothetical protein TSUD_154340 [Trifolium subterraneum]